MLSVCGDRDGNLGKDAHDRHTANRVKKTVFFRPQEWPFFLPEICVCKVTVMARLVMMCASDGLEKHVLRYGVSGFLMALVLALSGCQSPGRMGVVSSTWQGWSPERQKTVKQSYTRVKAWQGDSRSNHLSGRGDSCSFIRWHGVMGKKTDKRSHYQPLSWVLSPGQCKTVQLQTLPEKAKVALSSCYLKHVFSLDPSSISMVKACGHIVHTSAPLIGSTV